MVAALAAGIKAWAHEQYPSRPIKVIVPFGPGSATDIVIRIVGEHMRPILSQAVLVENKPGAFGIIAIEEMARARPDGYTLQIGNSGTNALAPIIYKRKFKIDYEQDVTMVTPLSEIPKVIEPIANGDVDLAFGSRALDRKLIGVHQPWRREQAGRVFNFIVRLATGMPFWDTQCGLKAFRLNVCRPILEKANTIGFAFDVELLFLAYRAGLRLREVPVRWNHAEGSKVHVIHDSLRMLREVIALRMSS